MHCCWYKQEMMTVVICLSYERNKKTHIGFGFSEPVDQDKLNQLRCVVECKAADNWKMMEVGGHRWETWLDSLQDNI